MSSSTGLQDSGWIKQSLGTIKTVCLMILIREFLDFPRFTSYRPFLRQIQIIMSPLRPQLLHLRLSGLGIALVPAETLYWTSKCFRATKTIWRGKQMALRSFDADLSLFRVL